MAAHPAAEASALVLGHWQGAVNVLGFDLG